MLDNGILSDERRTEHLLSTFGPFVKHLLFNATRPTPLPTLWHHLDIDELRTLKIDADNFEHINGDWHFPYLTELHLTSYDWFVGQPMNVNFPRMFPKLETLVIERCLCFEQKDDQCWPRALKSLTLNYAITDRVQLANLLRHSPQLQHMTVHWNTTAFDFNDVINAMADAGIANSLQTLDLCSARPFGELMLSPQLKQFRELRELRLYPRANAGTVENARVFAALPSLTYLSIRVFYLEFSLPFLKAFGAQPPPQLRKFIIRNVGYKHKIEMRIWREFEATMPESCQCEYDVK